MDPVGILILDDETTSNTALRQMLDSEGWEVTVVTSPEKLLPLLATGKIRLVIADAVRCGISGPVFDILSELAHAPAAIGGKLGVRVLFLVPAKIASQAQLVFEQRRLTYLLKPFHLHDFFEKVSDLLTETGAITEPLSLLQREAGTPLRVSERPKGKENQRKNTMFAERKDYMMSEEELLEWERNEAAERKKKKKGPLTSY
jgi:DNA-binding response OmpR family regulator